MDDPLTPTGVPAPVAPAGKHSWLGIFSFIISLVGGLGMLLLFAIAGYVQMSTPGGMDEKSPAAVVVGLLLFAIAGVLLVGLGLGIAGLVQKEKKRVFAVLGLVFNSLVILGTLALVVIGNSVE
jgi:hypothetical protein